MHGARSDRLFFVSAFLAYVALERDHEVVAFLFGLICAATLLPPSRWEFLLTLLQRRKSQSQIELSETRESPSRRSQLPREEKEPVTAGE